MRLAAACSPTSSGGVACPFPLSFCRLQACFPRVDLSGDGTADKSNGLQSYIHKSCSGSMFLQISVLLRVSFSNQENKL